MGETMKFHEIDISEVEEKYILNALRKGQVSGRGENTMAVEAQLKEMLAADCVLMTTSGTHALEMAVRLCKIKAGDEVILPSYTFPSTANAVLAVGARPVFIPVDQETMSIASGSLSQYVTDKTKAVIAVHYAGICHDIDKIAAYCRDKDLILIEDAAQAFGSTYKGRPLGTYGKFGCLSFHGTKNDVSGEGGALIIAEGDPSVIENAERLLEKGTDRMAFMRGDQSKYEWKGFGSSYVPSDLLMALLRGQLESLEGRMEKRREIIGKYIQAFSKYESEHLTLFSGFAGEYPRTECDPLSPEGYSNAHLFYLLFSNASVGQMFARKMQEKSIPVRQHFMPLHTSDMGRSLGYAKGDLEFESDIFDRLYRLPVHPKLTEDDLEVVIGAVSETLERLVCVQDDTTAEVVV